MHRAKHKEKMALFSGKRIAAFVLAFLLCVGTLPLNSFAVEGEDMSQDTPAATEYVVDADVSDPTSDKSFIEDEAPDRKSSAACTSINIYLHEGEAYVASSYHQGAGHDPQGNS